MKKRLIALLLVLVLAACVFPVSAFAATPVAAPSGLQYNETFFYNMYSLYYIVNKNTNVSQGAVWGHVACIQSLMNRFYECTGNTAYYVGTVDSDFGPATNSAVTTFQANMGLTADGIVGWNTWTTFNTRWQNDIVNKWLPHVTGVGD
ncbi:MAG: peptidoglycan-binding domain-containing protein [Oscillospiraceae bacterium]|nr:peptidoglycan-binding domain-containing protein [Oscillospiraceae bacterium]